MMPASHAAVARAGGMMGRVGVHHGLAARDCQMRFALAQTIDATELVGSGTGPDVLSVLFAIGAGEVQRPWDDLREIECAVSSNPT